MGCNQSRPTSSVPAVEETRYQITFLLEHEMIGEFGEKIITNPLNSSSDSYKKEMKQNVYIKSIHSSVAKYVQLYGMNVGDIIETISVEGTDYPLIKLEISRTSHPYYTGKAKLVDTAGRIDKFKTKYAKFSKK